MLIALLVVLGVNLIVVVALLALIIARRRWLGEVRRLGDGSVAVRLETGRAAVEIAVQAEQAALAHGTFGPTVTNRPVIG